MTVLIPRRLKSGHIEWRREDDPKCPGGGYCEHVPVCPPAKSLESAFDEPDCVGPGEAVYLPSKGTEHSDHMLDALRLAPKPKEETKVEYDEMETVKRLRRKGPEAIKKMMDNLAFVLALDCEEKSVDVKFQDFENRIEAVNESHARMMSIIADICSSTGLRRGGETIGNLIEAISEYVDAEIRAHV